jgi:hypothetical protein
VLLFRPVTRIIAQVLGACAAVALAAGWYGYMRFRPPPCTGGVFFELRPPLLEPGPYHFRLELDGAERVCEFEASPDGTARKTACKMALEIDTRAQGNEKSIVGVAIGAAPEHLRFQVKQRGQALYDTTLEPKYTPWAIRREDSKRFCGDRALVKPDCVRGSAQCAPYEASCTGPEGCSSGKVCCASAEWAREYGVKAATECSSRRDCLDRFGRVACHRDSDCAEGSLCNDTSLRKDFSSPLDACGPKR